MNIRDLTMVAWLVPAGPLLAFVLITLGVHRSRGLSRVLALVGIFVALVLSMILLSEVVRQPTVLASLENTQDGKRLSWFRAGVEEAAIGVQVDLVDGAALGMVTIVCLMIFVYSLGYMHGDPKTSRFFAYISLFAGAMLGALVVDNLLAFFIFWEIMGTCSYLLIGFWWERESAYKAALKAFLVTKTGDAFMLLGLVLLYSQVGTLSYAGLFDQATVSKLAQTPFIGGVSVATMAALLLFGGTIGKSAQLPLHVWLPDAMEGPTPVSALIHAATMVSAGVYLMIRAYPLLEASQAMPVLAVVGTVTAVYAAVVALAQRDIKRVLAFSTISQLGYMVAALGIGAYAASVFHLITHAFFKALLFMAAGSVIHGMEHGHHQLHGHAVPQGEADFDPNDMALMGGLAFRMPVTAITFLIGSLSLSGFPLVTAGFWSKDEILAEAWRSSPSVFWALTVTAGLTGFYAARQIGLVFLGAPRSRVAVHARESGAVMVLPLVILALFSISLGWLGIPREFPLLGRVVPFHFMDLISHSISVGEDAAKALTGGSFVWQPLALSVLFGLGGLVAGWFVYSRYSARADNEFRDPVEGALSYLHTGWLYRAMVHRFYFDEAYQALFVRPTLALADAMALVDHRIIDGIVVSLASGFGGRGIILPAARAADRHLWDGLVNAVGAVSRSVAQVSLFLDTDLIDGAVNAIARGTRTLGRWVRRTQTGHLPDYLWNAFAIVLVLVAALLLFHRF